MKHIIAIITENGKQKQETSKCDRFAVAKLYYKECVQLSLVIWFCHILNTHYYYGSR